MTDRQPEVDAKTGRLVPFTQDDLLEQVVGLIRASGLSPYQIAIKAGLQERTVERWLTVRCFYARSTSLEAVLRVLGYRLEPVLIRQNRSYH